jgi:hypothetical protein
MPYPTPSDSMYLLWSKATVDAARSWWKAVPKIPLEVTEVGDGVITAEKLEQRAVVRLGVDGNHDIVRRNTGETHPKTEESDLTG